VGRRKEPADPIPGPDDAIIEGEYTSTRRAPTPQTRALTKLAQKGLTSARRAAHDLDLTGTDAQAPAADAASVAPAAPARPSQKGLTGAKKPPREREPAGALVLPGPRGQVTADDAARQGHVTEDRTPLHEAPAANREILARLYNGTNLEILERAPATNTNTHKDKRAEDPTEWVRVRVALPGQSDGTGGWVAGAYIAPGHRPVAVDDGATRHVAVSPGINLRRAAGGDQALVQPTPLPKGLNLEVLGQTGVTTGYDLARQSKTWLHVRIRSTSVEGWVPKEHTAPGSSFLPTAIARLMPLINQASITTGLSPALIAAVVWQESMGDPNARVGTGTHAWGLMLLRPETAREHGGSAYGMTFEGGFRPDNPLHRQAILNPQNNLMTGATYLALLLDRYRSAEWGAPPEQLAVAAYHAGPAAVDNARDIPHDAGTPVYVATSLGLHQRFSDALHIPGPWQVHAS